MSRRHSGCSCSRRDFLARGLYGIGIGAGLPLVLSRTSAVLAAEALQGTSVEKHPERILVVIELSGGNDGLNTVVPFGLDGYDKGRRALRLPKGNLHKISKEIGLATILIGNAVAPAGVVQAPNWADVVVRLD